MFEKPVAICLGDKIMTAYQNADCDWKTVLYSTYQIYCPNVDVEETSTTFALQ